MKRGGNSCRNQLQLETNDYYQYTLNNHSQLIQEFTEKLFRGSWNDNIPPPSRKSEQTSTKSVDPGFSWKLCHIANTVSIYVSKIHFNSSANVAKLTKSNAAWRLNWTMTMRTLDLNPLDPGFYQRVTVFVPIDVIDFCHSSSERLRLRFANTALFKPLWKFRSPKTRKWKASKIDSVNSKPNSTTEPDLGATNPATNGFKFGALANFHALTASFTAPQ